MNAKYTASELAARGYRRVSRAYGMVARVDRDDWCDVLAKETHESAEKYRKHPELWADFYRRVHSKDCLEVGKALALQVPPSDHDPIGFVPYEPASAQ